MGGFNGPVRVSEPAMLAIPVERSANALAQPDARVEPDLLPRARDVERAALRVEVDAPPVYRRLDAEGRAERFADRARGPERPHRHVHARRPHAGDVRD